MQLLFVVPHGEVALLNVSFVENDDPAEVVVFADGHADWDKIGQDIVCAAASVLLQTLWLGLTDVVHVSVRGGWSTGKFQLTLDRDLMARPEVNALVKTTARALQNLGAQYPKHVRVRVQGSW